ncbi:unnamed protein product [Closterium sp. NIES-64]|nr:unnamed protein product [Closterium sp. NIES-64]
MVARRRCNDCGQSKEQQKKMSPGEEMESEWQQIVDLLRPGQCGEARGGGEEEGAAGSPIRHGGESRAGADSGGVLRHQARPKQSLEELEKAAAEVAEEDEWNFPQGPGQVDGGGSRRGVGGRARDAKVPFYDPLLGLSALDAADDDAAPTTAAAGSAQAAAREAAAFGGPVCAVPAGAAAGEREDDGSSGALKALEELEMEEEFLQYEGTVWNDMAQGKGVYTTPLELCKAMASSPSTSLRASRRQTPSEPPRNPMRSSFPAVPLFPSFLPSWFLAWRKLKAEGKVFEDEEMSAEDREWLRMELEDLSTQEADAKKAGAGGEGAGAVEDPTDAVPFEDHPGWLKVFGRKPEKGHYEYAGQMKQNKFHGCGVFTLNGKMHFGKFRFGEFLRNKDECDAHTSGVSAPRGAALGGSQDWDKRMDRAERVAVWAAPVNFAAVCMPCHCASSPGSLVQRYAYPLPRHLLTLPSFPSPPALPGQFHAGMARVAAAKARMFVNKPDGSKSLPPLPPACRSSRPPCSIHAVRLFLPLHGLPAVVREVKGPYNEPSHRYLYDDNGMWQAPVAVVREVKGPYNEPSHPYLYDEDDMWQAPGFIHEFHAVPPCGAKEEFVVLRNSPRLPERAGESAEEAEMRRADMQGQVLVHVPSRQIINWTTDEEGKLRLFVQPFTKDGKVDPSKARPLPLGFDEFIKGEEMEQEEEEEEEQEESEEARRLKTPEQLQRDAQRRRAKAAEARRRRVARLGAALRNQVAWRREQREEEWARQDAEEEELRRLEEEEWQREGDLMDADRTGGGRGWQGGCEGRCCNWKAAAGGSGAGEEEEGSESESEGESDDEDEDEDERKPRSFGTVAMAVALQQALHHAARSISSLRRLLLHPPLPPPLRLSRLPPPP